LIVLKVDRFFRIFFICVFSALIDPRLYFRIRSGLFHEPLYSPKELVGFILFRSIIGMVMTARAVREERVLIEPFGDAYRAYREKTVAFIPKPGK
jgi:protein-S-isoprenylcysteine O-methyltransferase Ste14